MTEVVAVTGAGGFIGRAVCRELVRTDQMVWALVGPPGDPLPTPPGVARAARAAMGDRATLKDFLAGADAVIHLAGPPSVRASFDDPEGFVAAHAGGTATLLAVCRDLGIDRFVYVSSAEVYGRPRTDPVAESHPLEARSPYAAAKIGAEALVQAFDHARGTASVILRPFSVYGSGMGAHALIPAIVRQLGSDESVQLADLRPERDYCHVDDVARAIAAAVCLRLTETVALNIGSGIGVSVRELAQTAVDLSGRGQQIEEDPARRRPGNSDILRLVADRRLAGSLLAWTPQISLADGLRDLLSIHAGAA